jgi:hypothetical protein
MESLYAARDGSPSSCALRTYGSVSWRRSQLVELVRLMMRCYTTYDADVPLTALTIRLGSFP